MASGIDVCRVAVENGKGKGGRSLLAMTGKGYGESAVSQEAGSVFSPLREIA